MLILGLLVLTIGLTTLIFGLIWLLAVVLVLSEKISSSFVVILKVFVNGFAEGLVYNAEPLCYL